MRQTFVLAVAFAAVAAGFLAGADAQTCKSLIPDLEAVAGDYGITQFVNLLKETNALSAGAYTIFAPSDSAVSGTIASLGIGGPTTWTEQQKYILTNVLLYHVAPGNLPSTGISKFGASVNTLASNQRLCTGTKTIAGDKNVTDNFNSLTLKVSGKTVTVVAGENTATVVQADITVKCQPNIIIHKIDSVLLPCDFTKYLKAPLPSPVTPPSPKVLKKSPAPSPAKCANGSSVFTALSAPIADATVLPPLLKSILQPGFVGTVFVPSDLSLMALSESLNVSADALKALQTSPIFTDLLSYHVVPTTIYAPTAAGTKTLTTYLSGLQKQSFCATPSNGTLEATSTGVSVTVQSPVSTVKVIGSESTCKGVIHVIDGVLLPCAASAKIQALLTSAIPNTTSPSPAAPGTTRGVTPPVTLVGTSPASGNSSAAGTTTSPSPANKSGAAAVAPPALAALLLAFLLAQLL